MILNDFNPVPSFGEHLVGAQPAMNPFGSRVPPSAGPTAPTAQLPPQQVGERIGGWKAFVNRFKTDPNLRLSLVQAAVALTQPAGNAAEAIGRAVGVGAQTFDALNERDYEKGRQTAADSRADRQVVVSERGVAETERRGTAQEGQFQQGIDLQKNELEARWEQIRNTKEYQDALIQVERERIAAMANGEAGQVNTRWSRLRDAMLADPVPSLAAIADPASRRARAELMAFDLINKSGQDQAKFIANFLQQQQLFLPDPDRDPQGYARGMQRLLQQAQAIAEGAQLGPTVASPTGAPPQQPTPPPTPAPGPAPQARPPTASPAAPQQQPGQATPGPAAAVPQAATPPPTPEQVTEEDILTTMTATGMSREQVVAELVRRGLMPNPYRTGDGF